MRRAKREIATTFWMIIFQGERRKSAEEHFTEDEDRFICEILQLKFTRYR